jgi:hypothetical protein
MLFWIFVAILVAGIVWRCIDAWSDGAVWLVIIGAVAVAGSIIGMIGAQTTTKAEIAAANQRYESLVYQYENDIYENDNDLGKRELMQEIQEWNEDLAINRELQDNFWVGIYIPDIYDQFKFIELDKPPIV